MTMVWDARFPTPLAKLIALKLADCANDDGANVFPSRRTIERATEAGTTTVKTWLAAFECSGLLVVDSRSAGGARRDTTVRRFDMTILRDLSDGRCRFVEGQMGSWTLACPMDANERPLALGPGRRPTRSDAAPVGGGRLGGPQTTSRGAATGPKPSGNRQERRAHASGGQDAAATPAHGVVRIPSTDPRFPRVIDLLARSSRVLADACVGVGYADVRPDQLSRVSSDMGTRHGAR